MDFRQLLYAVQVSEESSFSKAAEKLHIAQPSLSQQIGKLEQQLGVTLFDRSSQPVRLTYAGEIFIAKALRILDQLQELKKEMEDVADLKKGRLVIGSLPITGAHLLPGILPIFQQQFPGIELVLIEETTRKLEELTAKGTTDISLLALPLENPALAYEPVLTEEILLAVPSSHPLAVAADSKPVQLSKLADEPFILLKRGQGFRQYVLHLCRENGFEPEVVFETTNIETAQSLAASGMGVTLVPQMVARPAGKGGNPTYLKLAGRPTRTLVIAYRAERYLSRPAKSFIELINKKPLS